MTLIPLLFLSLLSNAALADFDRIAAETTTTGTVCTDGAPCRHGRQEKTEKFENAVGRKPTRSGSICRTPGSPYYISGVDTGPAHVLQTTAGVEAAPVGKTITVEVSGKESAKGHPICEGEVFPQERGEEMSCGNTEIPVGRRMTTLMDISRRSPQHPNFQPVCKGLQNYFENNCGPDIGKTREDRIARIKSLITPALSAERFPGTKFLPLNSLAVAQPKSASDQSLNEHARESILLCLMQHEHLEFNPIKTSTLTCKETGHSDFGLGQLVRASVVDIVDRAPLLSQLGWPENPVWRDDSGKPLDIHTGLEVYNNLGENIGLQIQVITLFINTKWPKGGNLQGALERYHGERNPKANRRYANTILACYDKLMSSRKPPGIYRDPRLTVPQQDEQAISLLAKHKEGT